MWNFSSACVLMAVNNKPLEKGMQIVYGGVLQTSPCIEYERLF